MTEDCPPFSLQTVQKRLKFPLPEDQDFEELASLLMKPSVRPLVMRITPLTPMSPSTATEDGGAATISIRLEQGSRPNLPKGAETNGITLKSERLWDGKGEQFFKRGRPTKSDD